MVLVLQQNIMIICSSTSTRKCCDGASFYRTLGTLDFDDTNQQRGYVPQHHKAGDLKLKAYRSRASDWCFPWLMLVAIAVGWYCYSRHSESCVCKCRITQALVASCGIREFKALAFMKPLQLQEFLIISMMAHPSMLIYNVGWCFEIRLQRSETPALSMPMCCKQGLVTVCKHPRFYLLSTLST